MIEELFERGYSVWRDAAPLLIHRSRCRTFGALVRHHFTRGRGMGRILVEEAVNAGDFPGRRIPRFVVINVPARLRYVTRLVWAHGRGLRATYLRTLPGVVAGAVSWWLGAVWEIARRTRSARRTTGGGASS